MPREPDSSKTDEHCWRCVAQGDLTAFEELHHRYAVRVEIFLHARCRPPLSVEDLAQEVWTRVWNARTTTGWSPGLGRFSSWLLKIANNSLISEIRRPRTRIERTAAELPERPSNFDNGHAERLAALQECLEQLGGDFVEVLRLQIVEGLDGLAIAERMQIPLGTVYSRASRGRNEVHECVTQKLS